MVCRVPLAVLSFFVCALTGPAACANDTAAEAPLGGLTFTKSNTISMESEDLYISRDLVRVHYRFINKTDAPIDTLVAFPLPDIPPETREEDLPDYMLVAMSDLKFKTSVDGQPLALQRVEQAFFKGRDVSARLLALGIPLNRFAEGFDAAINRLPNAERGRLIADGLIRDDGFSEPIWTGLWTLRTTLTRHQTFPPQKAITVEHAYVPMAGGTVGARFDPQYRTQVSPSDFAEMRRKYCIDDDWLRSIDKKLRSLKKGDNSRYNEVWLGYVLKTGANWRGPIGDFHLVIDKGKPDSDVSFCAEGVKKISPTQFEVRRSNFTPNNDLDILIIDWAR